MKKKANAREKREQEALRRKQAFAPEKASLPEAKPLNPPDAAGRKAESIPAQTPEEDALEFLAYLDRHGVPADKDTAPTPAARKANRPAGAVPSLNLEEGMPVVSEAVSRMRTGIQEMRCGNIRVIKLIHGYGSTGRGGKICPAVREELAAMKRKKYIAEYIPGEAFGPLDAASRRLAEQNPAVTRDPDYGRMNHGITIVALKP